MVASLYHWLLEEAKSSVPCSVLLSNNYVIVKAYDRNITSSTNLAYSKKVNLQVPASLSFQGLPLFLGKEKSSKCTHFAAGRCFVLSILLLLLLRA